MKSIFCTIFLFFFVFSLLFIQEAYGQQTLCEWTLPQDGVYSVREISHSGNHKVFSDINGQQLNPLELMCVFDVPVSLEKKLIGFEFEIKSNVKYDLKLLLVDTNRDTIYTSSQLLELYGINQDSRANVVLDPADFDGGIEGEISVAKDLNSIQSLKLEFNQNNFESILISNPNIITIKKFPDYRLDENLPIQSTVPGFLGLILISFPLGFVLLQYSNFLKEENFFVKVPWFLGFGFCIYMVFIYLISHYWISFEIVLGYVIFELGILLLYFKKNKISFLNFLNPKSKNIIIFFSTILIIAGILSVNYVEQIGWPTGINDARVHVAGISLTVANNVLHNSTSFLPISDIPGWFFSSDIPYPNGSYATTAGLSFFTGAFPAVSMEATNGFIIFLIPLMLSSIVYKFSKSIFLTSIMFIITYWVPTVYRGDIMMFQITASNFSAHIGIIGLLTSLMIFIAYFEKGNKLKLFIYFAISIFAVAVSYTGYFILPIIIGIIGFLIYYLKNNKQLAIIFAILLAVFISMPLWSFTAHELVGLTQKIPYIHDRYLLFNPINPSSELFPLWISSALGIICASLLFFNKRYRPFSIIVLLVSLVHFLPISSDLALYYSFFHKSLRSVGLMFLLSIAMNLIMFHFITKQLKLFPEGFLSKLVKKDISKIIVLGLLVLLLFPGFQILEDRKEVLNDTKYFRITNSYIDTIPGGNERNLQYWLYENAKPNDLVLNDLSTAAEMFIGFRAQNLINGQRQDVVISYLEVLESKKFEFTRPAVSIIHSANEILKYPWNYDEIEEIIRELDIKYLYISERERFDTKKGFYPNTENWPWKDYSGNARIAMYENHPSLELILRNGNSAIFKVL